MSCNVESLCKIISEHGDPFISNETCLYNILTHTVTEKKAEEEILNRDTIGQNLFEKYTVRLMAHLLFGIQIKERTLHHLKEIIKQSMEIIKPERGEKPLQKFVIIARSHKELNLEECFGNFEFGVVPRSLFSADGSLLLTKDKHKVVNWIIKSIDDNIKW